ncbi:hypothetical protein B0H14DRAFT_2607410 [Mycena olivaceomarginata]|nr:hypothetical protein B0H14DRAFT_2607410 [Mycena olivaceomarginata]
MLPSKYFLSECMFHEKKNPSTYFSSTELKKILVDDPWSSKLRANWHPGAAQSDTCSKKLVWVLALDHGHHAAVEGAVFDGSNAATIRGEGSMDAKDLLIWGKIDPHRWPDERGRINDICAWGKEFEIGGYV